MHRVKFVWQVATQNSLLKQARDPEKNIFKINLVECYKSINFTS